MSKSKKTKTAKKNASKQKSKTATKNKSKGLPQKKKQRKLPQPEEKQVPVSQLKHHPLKYKIFAEPKYLVVNGKRTSVTTGAYSIKEPIEILSDGTIIHNNNAFFGRWDDPEFQKAEVNVIVRHDLEAAGEKAILERLTEDRIFKLTQFEKFKVELVLRGHKDVLEKAYRGEPLDKAELKRVSKIPLSEMYLKACAAKYPINWLLDFDTISMAVAAETIDLPEEVLQEIDETLDVENSFFAGTFQYHADNPLVDCVVLDAVLKHERSKALLEEKVAQFQAA